MTYPTISIMMIVDNGRHALTNVINYPGAVEIGSNVNTQALDVTGLSILNGRVVIGSNTFEAYIFDVTGSSRFKNSLLVDGIYFKYYKC
jgi:hypothetical protein